MLMEEMPAAGELKPVEADNEMKMAPSFVEKVLYTFRAHLRKVNILELAEGSAGGRSDEPIRFGLFNKEPGFTSICGKIKVPWFSSRFRRWDVESMETTNIQIRTWSTKAGSQKRC